jgi:Tol biopolymer transport system component
MIMAHPLRAQVYGFDGVLRERIHLPGSVLRGSGIDGTGIADIEWSPAGTRLAVSTFRGSWVEPICGDWECEARVWILDAGGGDPVLVYRRTTPPGANPNPPILTNLAWAPDGDRLGLVSAGYYPERAAPPTLVSIAVESGQAETIYEFDDCGTCNPARYGFAWSPDGTRIAVTNGAGIAQLSADGTVLVPTVGSEHGPLAWLIRKGG